jgi:hypothetical protein
MDWVCDMQECVSAIAYSGSHPFVIRVYDEAGNVLETHERDGDFREQ